MITLRDAKRGTELLVLPATPGECHGALCIAARQARRHAAVGMWVLLSSHGKHYLYVGKEYYIACTTCGRWMPPSHRQECCAACRHPDPPSRAAARRKTPPALPSRAPARLKHPAPPDMLLRLPGLSSPRACCRPVAGRLAAGR